MFKRLHNIYVSHISIFSNIRSSLLFLTISPKNFLFYNFILMNSTQMILSLKSVALNIMFSLSLIVKSALSLDITFLLIAIPSRLILYPILIGNPNSIVRDCCRTYTILMMSSLIINLSFNIKPNVDFAILSQPMPILELLFFFNYIRFHKTLYGLAPAQVSGTAYDSKKHEFFLEFFYGNFFLISCLLKKF